MNKNIKRMFFVLTLVTLLATVGAVCAVDDTNSTAVTDNSVSDVEVSDSVSDTVAAEPATTDDNKVNTKIIEKENKNLKTATKTVEVNNFNEFTTSINNAINDADNNEYIINLNTGNYQMVNNFGFTKSSPITKSITINGNNQVINSSLYTNLNFNNVQTNIIIKDLTINSRLNVYTTNMILINVITNNGVNIYSNSNITIQNSTLNNTLNNNAKVTLADDCIFTQQFSLGGTGQTITNDTERLIPYMNTFNGTYTLKNMNITSPISNYGNLTISNSTINTTINHYSGILTIDDDVTFGQNTTINGNGQFVINDTDKILPYMNTFNGTYTLKNMNITSQKTNYGNLTISNSTINTTINHYSGILTIDDYVTFGSQAVIVNSAPIVINNTDKILPYLRNYNDTYVINDISSSFGGKYNYGNLTIKNSTIFSSNGGQFANYGDLTIIDSKITASLYNGGGTLTIINSTINNGISNYKYNYVTGTIILGDDVIFGENFAINGELNIVCNDTDKILPYIPTYSGNYTLNNITITQRKTNNGNLTLNNTTINAYITNNGNLTIDNTTINQGIINNGNLTLGNNITFSDQIQISGNGKVISENINQVLPYMTTFYGETTVSLEKSQNLQNYGNLTIENSTINKQFTNNQNSQLTFDNCTINFMPFNYGTMTITNTTLNTTIQNTGELIISDDTLLTGKVKISGNGTITINDTERIAPLLMEYNGNYTLQNMTINEMKTNHANLTLINCIINNPITNKGNLTLINCTLNSTSLSNTGVLTIDENTNIIRDNHKITGTGVIITNNITPLLNYISRINGNHTISDTNLTKKYTFNGNVTLNNCNITIPNNSNLGTLTLNNCTVNVGEENIFIDNLGTLIIRKDTEIIGQINNNGGQTNYSEAPKVYVVNNRTVDYFFNSTGLTSIVNPGDTLDFQGEIKINGKTLIVDKPVNIISTTKDAYVDLNTTGGSYMGENPGASFIINKDGSYTNVSGIYFHNTQLWLYNTNHVILDNISAVVENQRVGSGVGQTSIRANSSYITVKNSYFYTKDNGGSSTLVLAWADNCIIENNTIEGDGFIGNMLYITTYNIDIPTDIIFNSHNKLINNTIRGPEAQPTCFGICFCGIDNLIDGNTITYNGTGITQQWGSGIDGIETSESAFNNSDNIVSNNKLYGGCGINAGDVIYNNYMEGRLSAPKLAYNNTANSANIYSETSELINNTILGPITIIDGINSSKIINNTITGDINIPQRTNTITITGNNITGNITLDGSNNIITDNNIITNQEYTITSKRTSNGNIITNNHLIAKTLTGDKSVNINKDTNTIENNTPYENILKINTEELTVGQNTTITASIYNGQDINTSINKGKVTFKVNGKTLKDENGKVIYAKVVNGTATIENYIVPEDWAKEGTTIQAVYSGSTQCEKLTSEKTNITVNPKELTLTTTASTTQLTATLSDNTINTGKIVFKINGKTVKDANGKVIYAKVVNGTASVDYTLPESYKAGNYTVTATFIASGYDRLEASETLTVTA